MNDSISRQAAIDAVAEGLKGTFVEYRDVAEKMLNKVPSAQPESEERKEESAQNVPKEDLISRKAAIEALKEAFNPSITNFVKAKIAIDNLPSAQPEIKTDGDTISRQAAIEAVEILLEQTEEDADVKTWNNAIRGAINSIKHHVSSAQPKIKADWDTISRQDAIDAVEHITSSMSVCVNTDECHGMKRMQRQAVIELANLPSAQPESDKEQLCRLIRAGIIATDAKDVYSCGMRNGMRWCRSLLDDKEPKFEDASQYAQQERKKGEREENT